MLIESKKIDMSPLEICRLLLDSGFKDIVFLDSSDKTSGFSKHSYIFCDPFYKFTSRGNPFDKMKHLLGKYAACGVSDDFPAGAAAGYFSYDAGFYLEKIREKGKAEFSCPNAEFGFYDFIISFDHSKRRYKFISTGLPETDKHEKHMKARRRMERFQNIIGNANRSALSEIAGNRLNLKLSSDLTYAEYSKAIARIREYIAQGDVYQVNYSRRFRAPLGGVRPFDLYMKIREKNTVPFGAYIKSGSREILSFSMERFLKMEHDKIETRPIKGTIERGKTKQEDIRNSKILLNSVKNKAELVMITDLERNDLGRVCDYGTIRVDPLYEIEKYATVFHLVSTVKGRLHEKKTHLDCFKACFPGGSITGAPKIRAMEIIGELEKSRRNVYCGSIGYFGFNGISDFNINIRSIAAVKNKLYFNSGGGITWDSKPKSEYEETIHKVKTFLEVLG